MGAHRHLFAVEPNLPINNRLAIGVNDEAHAGRALKWCGGKRLTHCAGLTSQGNKPLS